MRRKVIARKIAYHGTTYGALSLTGITSIRAPFEPLMAGVRHVEPTNPYRCKYCADQGGCNLKCADEVAEVIASQTGRTAEVVKGQLLELLQVAGEQTSRLASTLEPLEEQLESLLDELNATLRPRIEKPVREKPLMAIGIAAGVGVLLGLLLASGRRSS
jgi:adenosylmethionine-8-amino-7-oxononanoate aminotransferase